MFEKERLEGYAPLVTSAAAHRRVLGINGVVWAGDDIEIRTGVSALRAWVREFGYGLGIFGGCPVDAVDGVFFPFCEV